MSQLDELDVVNWQARAEAAERQLAQLQQQVDEQARALAASVRAGAEAQQAHETLVKRLLWHRDIWEWLSEAGIGYRAVENVDKAPSALRRCCDDVDAVLEGRQTSVDDLVDTWRNMLDQARAKADAAERAEIVLREKLAALAQTWRDRYMEAGPFDDAADELSTLLGERPDPA